MKKRKNEWILGTLFWLGLLGLFALGCGINELLIFFC